MSVKQVQFHSRLLIGLAALMGLTSCATKPIRQKAVVVENTELVQMASKGLIDEVAKQIESGASANAVNSLGVSALFAASYKGHLSLVELLLKNGADPNHQNQQGGSAIEAAAIKNRANVLKVLLDSGGNANLKNNFQQTPLVLAVSLGGLEATRVLLDKGANLEVQDEHGWTPIFLQSLAPKKTLRSCFFQKERTQTTRMKAVIPHCILPLKTKMQTS